MKIEITSLRKSFNNKELFSIPCLALEKGFTCLYGPSGCGKTTLGRIICGLEKADEGKITGIRGNTTVLFQESRLLPSLGALQNVSIVIRPKEKMRLAKEILQRLGLEDEDMKKLPSELSGGMTRRVAIARALAFASTEGGGLVLLDEPFTGLDHDTKRLCAEVIEEFLKEKTVLVITHSPEDAELLRAKTLNFSDITS